MPNTAYVVAFVLHVCKGKITFIIAGFVQIVSTLLSANVILLIYNMMYIYIYNEGIGKMKIKQTCFLQRELNRHTIIY